MGWTSTDNASCLGLSASRFKILSHPALLHQKHRAEPRVVLGPYHDLERALETAPSLYRAKALLPRLAGWLARSPRDCSSAL